MACKQYMQITTNRPSFFYLLLILCLDNYLLHLASCLFVISRAYSLPVLVICTGVISLSDVTDEMRKVNSIMHSKRVG